MHIDLNSCFATIEQQTNPLLRGKPIAVVFHQTPLGVILTSSGEAKKLGIKTGVRVNKGRDIYKNLITKKVDPWKNATSFLGSNDFRGIHHQNSTQIHR